jgi:environmental stress-induced protein Ves
MQHLLANEYTSMPWKNGRGVTREVAKSYDDNGLIWRLSSADITQDGPFSNFPNLSRVLIVTIGMGVHLIDTYTDTKMLASLHKPTLFSGDQPIEAQLMNGPIQNFNVIYDSTKTKSAVRILKGPKSKKLSPRSGESHAVYCLLGTLKLNQKTLNQDETGLIIIPDITNFSCPEGSKALLVTFIMLP